MNFQDTQFGEFQDDGGMFVSDWLGWLGIAFLLTLFCAVGGYVAGSM